MGLERFWGKLIQLSDLPLTRWSQFVHGWLRRQRSGAVPCVLPGSVRLIHVPLRDFYESYQYFSESNRGRNELRFFVNQLRPGDVIYDVGAFRGAYGAAAKATLGESVSVHLFEPVKRNVEAIEAISRLNQFQQFKIVPQALGGSTTIKGRLDQESGMLREGVASNGQLPVEMPATSMDAYVKETGISPSIIKFDVEGFELEVLSGARFSLAQHKPRIWLELHPAFLASAARSWEEAIATLKSLGYRAITFYDDYTLPTRDLAFHIWCEP